MRRFAKILLLLVVLLLAAGGALYVWGTKLVVQSHRYEPLIVEAANRYHIDPNLIRAVIWRESDFQPDVTGLAQERGLMQVTPDAGKEWAKAEKFATFRETDLFDPRTNIFAGSWYLARAINRWASADEPAAFALAEYNAGRTHARRWASNLQRWEAAPFIDNIDYPTTKAYIQDILEKRDSYKTNPDSPSVYRALRNEIAAHIWRWRQAMSVKKRPVSPQGS
ncbi:MAG: lytic transglycosylase domain-containing protein [Verrucomicrobiales bacterium]|jgi:soluble lytic murein transglycosylase|nr:lytic transglycosylase domain-containing protein [Verrucomicrobiales bacterium]